MGQELLTDPPDPDVDEDDSLPLRELVRLAGGRCRDCAAAFTAREAVFSIALGFKNAPRCLTCLSNRLGRDATDLRTSLTDYVYRRECYLRAWREAERMDELHQNPHPPAHVQANPDRKVGGCEPEESGAGEQGSPVTDWDAGDMGCGELVMALRMRMKNLPAGGVIKVTATDPAAPEDLPAWCRLTGHTLLAADHPVYLIRRKED